MGVSLSRVKTVKKLKQMADAGEIEIQEFADREKTA